MRYQTACIVLCPCPVPHNIASGINLLHVRGLHAEIAAYGPIIPIVSSALCGTHTNCFKYTLWDPSCLAFSLSLPDPVFIDVPFVCCAARRVFWCGRLSLRRSYGELRHGAAVLLHLIPATFGGLFITPFCTSISFVWRAGVGSLAPAASRACFFLISALFVVAFSSLYFGMCRLVPRFMRVASLVPLVLALGLPSYFLLCFV